MAIVRAARLVGQPPVHDVFWPPDPKQQQLLGADDLVVLYGGAAGGGKTDALVIDAGCLHHNGNFQPPKSRHPRPHLSRTKRHDWLRREREATAPLTSK